MSSRKKINKARIVVVGCVLLGLWVILSPFLATFLIVDRPLDKADAILLLSGSAVYKERTRKAAELYKEQVSDRIFITNDATRAGWFDEEKSNVPFAELEKRQLIAYGLPEDAVTVLPQPVAGTDDEARSLRAELEARPLARVIIVTSAYHTRRSLWTFDRILDGTNVELGIAHPPPGLQTPSPNYWWLKPRGWQMVAAEYVKSFIYSFYY